MSRRAAGLASGAALLVVVLVVWRLPQSDEADAPRPPGSAAPEGWEQRERLADALAAAGTGAVLPLPASLEGTSEDGALVVDEAGRFVATTDAIDLFDYYLAATGEESDEVVRARILGSIHSKLSGGAAQAAIALLDDYLVYRARASDLLGGRLVGEDLERRLQYIRELRREVFGAGVALALFGEEEARWAVDIERRRVAMDPSLASDEREQRLARLDAELPDTLLASRDASRVHRLLRDEEARLRADGAGANAIAQLREERVGVEAAARLAALDAERERWQARLAAYRDELDALTVDAPAEEHRAIRGALRSRHFDSAESLRVRALHGALAR